MKLFKKIAISALLFSFLVVPAVSHAIDFDLYGNGNPNDASNALLYPTDYTGSGRSSGRISSFEGLIYYIIGLFNYIIPFVITLALFWFMYGIMQFMRSAGDSTAREKGRWMMLYGIIGLAVMVSVWGLVNVVLGTFDLNYARPDIPQFRLR